MPNNTNIMHVNLIEGLVSEIHSHLEAISPKKARQAEVREMAVSRLAAWEKVALFELRKEFEE